MTMRVCGGDQAGRGAFPRPIRIDEEYRLGTDPRPWASRRLAVTIDGVIRPLSDRHRRDVDAACHARSQTNDQQDLSHERRS